MTHKVSVSNENVKIIDQLFNKLEKSTKSYSKTKHAKYEIHDNYSLRRKIASETNIILYVAEDDDELGNITNTNNQTKILNLTYGLGRYLST